MQHFKFICVGPPGAGKTEYGLRLICVNGTSGTSTYKANSFSITPLHTIIKKDEEEPTELWLDENTVSANMLDIAGQRNTINEIGPELPDCNGGLIYLIDGVNPDIEFLRNINSLIDKEYNRIKEDDISIEKPPVTVYLNKAQMKNVKINFDETKAGIYKLLKLNDHAITIDELLINQDEEGNKRFDDGLVNKVSEILSSNDKYKNLMSGFEEKVRKIYDDYEKEGRPVINIINKEIVKNEDYNIIDSLINEFIELEYSTLGESLIFCKEINATLFVGDSVGPDDNTPDAEIYMVRSLNKTPKEPIESNYDALLSSSIILKRATNRRRARELEGHVVADLREYGAI